MKTFDLTEQDITLEELLEVASVEGVRIITARGQTFVLEEADDFDQEVEMLGQSQKFQEFLKERKNQPSVMSVEDYLRSLT
jgi:hypothetical protein